MFLSVLNNNDDKRFFLELTRVVAIAEGDVAAFEQSFEWSQAKHLALMDFYEQMIGAMTCEAEKSKFEILAREIGFLSGETSDINTRVRAVMGHTTNQYSSPEEFDQKINLRERLRTAFTAAIKAKGADAELKKKVMGKLIEHGIELSAINEKLIKIKLSLMAEIRQPALLALIDDIFENRKEGVDTLTPPQRKAIMLELTAMGDVSGSIDPIERKVLEHIQQRLGLDVEFLDEAADIVQKINAASMEALELVTE